MTTHILTIGDELLIGQVVDTNAAWMAEHLVEAGFPITGMSSVADTEVAISGELRRLKADIILMTGGLGPTKDDVTKKALAAFFNVQMQFDNNTWERIQKLFERIDKSTTDAHYQQCYMPENAILLNNKMGTAPGMVFQKGEQIIISMPGVPYEMRYLMEYEVVPFLREKLQKEIIYHSTIYTVGEGEARLAKRIEKIENSLPQHIALSYLPSLGQVRLRLTGRGSDLAILKSEVDTKVQEIAQTIPEFVYGYGKTNLAESVGQLLQKRELTIGTAESCTGGYIAHQFTSNAGSSNYFTGSVIAYANAVKMNVLGVKEDTLQQHGAVSEQTVREMVAGVIGALDCDIGIAASGIAGPGGGTPEKPVGTIWIAAGNKDRIITKKLQLSKNRLLNVQLTAVRVLDLARKLVKGN